MDFKLAVLSAFGIQGLLKILKILPLYTFVFPGQAVVEDNSSFDIVIVGAGSAGCVLARRLSDNENVNVLLIEAGDNPGLEEMIPGLTLYTVDTAFDWHYDAENDKYAYQCYKNDVYSARSGRGLGGSSAVSYLLYDRGNPHYYRQWTKIANNSSWNFENLLPYFKKGERLEDETILNSKYGVFHGTQGEVGVSRAVDPDKNKYLNSVEEMGYKIVLDTNGNDTLGFNFPLYNVAEGKRQSSCYCYLSLVKDRKNLHVLKKTRVTKIIFDNKKAVGVEMIKENKEKITVSARLEVILSAGVYNSPQLLMLSGIGPTEHLQSHNLKTLVNLPVGFNLQDHVGVTIAHQTEPYIIPSPPLNPLEPALNAINGFIALNKSQTYPDAQLLLVSSKFAGSAPQLFTHTLSIDKDISQRAYNANKKREVLYAFILDTHCESRGRVMLRSADPTDSPQIFLGAFSNENDLNNVIRCVKDYLRIENTTYFRNVNAQRIDLAGDRCKGFTPDSEEYWRCYVLCLMVSIHHSAGTCPMGSVVDSELRVLGVTGLRVVDASIFPILPSGTTNTPTMMVAEKAADMIKQDYGI